MCREITLVRRDGRLDEAGSVGELRRLLGWRPPMQRGQGRDGPLSMDECLCWVDMPKLVRLAGWREVGDEDGWDDLGGISVLLLEDPDMDPKVRVEGEAA